MKCQCTANKHGETCGAEFQDQKYGRGNRVHTEHTSKGGHTCTVCGIHKAGAKKEVAAKPSK